MAGLYQQRGLFTTIIWTILSFRGRLYIVIYRNTVFSHTPAVPDFPECPKQAGGRRNVG